MVSAALAVNIGEGCDFGVNKQYTACDSSHTNIMYCDGRVSQWVWAYTCPKGDCTQSPPPGFGAGGSYAFCKLPSVASLRPTSASNLASTSTSASTSTFTSTSTSASTPTFTLQSTSTSISASTSTSTTTSASTSTSTTSISASSSTSSPKPRPRKVRDVCESCSLDGGYKSTFFCSCYNTQAHGDMNDFMWNDNGHIKIGVKLVVSCNALFN